MSSDIYTVVIVRSVEVKTPTGAHMRDTIETYYDVTWQQTLAYRAKHPDVEITIERQQRELCRMPRIEVGERQVPTPRALIDPNKFFDSSAVKSRPSREHHNPTTIYKHNTLDRTPVTSIREEVSEGYGELVNKMLKGDAA